MILGGQWPHLPPHIRALQPTSVHTCLLLTSPNRHGYPVDTLCPPLDEGIFRASSTRQAPHQLSLTRKNKFFCICPFTHDASLPPPNNSNDWLCYLSLTSGLDNNNRDLFYVIALVLHQLPGKVDPRQWHYQRNRDNAAARMRR